MKIGRNDLCFCGSGQKYKKCCLGRDIPEEFRHKVFDILPDRWDIDYGVPRIDDNFFANNEPEEISAPRMLFLAMVCPEQLERVAGRVRRETARHQKQAKEIRGLSGPEDLVRFLKNAPDRLNYPLILDKFRDHEEETVELLLEELRTCDDELFAELAVRLLYETDEDILEDLLDIIELDQRNAYTVSLICVLLGFYDHPSLPQLLWDYFHYFKEHFPKETYHQGPLLALIEMRESLEHNTSPYVGERPEHPWEEDSVATMNDQQIVARLKAVGVLVKKDEFLADIKGLHAASDLYHEWEDKYSINDEGCDDDFVLTACMELWKRWAPDVMFDERLGNMLMVGYAFLEEGKEREACDLWLKIWGHFKARFTGLVRSIEGADDVYRGGHSWYNWCQDFGRQLVILADKNRSYVPQAMAYFQEFSVLLPETAPQILRHLKEAEAKVLAMAVVSQNEIRK